jgi:hypothetical protein
MSAGETFNAAGVNGRDCPRCYRTGTLAGARTGDTPTLTCTGCHASFRLAWSSDPRLPDTLTQLAVKDPPRKPDFALTPSRGSR